MPHIAPPPPFRSRAPGSVMLMGEHAVLAGYPALVVAIDRHINIAWQPLPNSNRLIIQGNGSRFESDWQALLDHTSYPQDLGFVLAALSGFANFVLNQCDISLDNSGACLTISSDMDPLLGLGTSAAVCAAVLVGMDHLLQTHLETPKLFAIGLQAIHAQQNNLGSGADLAASLSGGLVAFQPSNPVSIQQLPQQLPISLVYVGYKTKTAEVIRFVHSRWEGKEDALSNLYRRMGAQTAIAHSALQQCGQAGILEPCTVDAVATPMQVYQQLMTELGVVDAGLSELYELMCQQTDLRGIKVSGSGLGDCILGLRTLPTVQLPGYQQINLTTDPCGADVVSVEEYKQ